jgi:hypothetical protein
MGKIECNASMIYDGKAFMGSCHEGVERLEKAKQMEDTSISVEYLAIRSEEWKRWGLLQYSSSPIEGIYKNPSKEDATALLQCYAFHDGIRSLEESHRTCLETIRGKDLKPMNQLTNKPSS